MAYVDVNAWPPECVVAWIHGLHKSLETTPLDKFIRNRINGNRLMMLMTQDLVEMIPRINVEALQTIIGGIKALKYLNYNCRVDTLQSLILNLACEAKYLHNQLIQAEQSPRLLPVSTTAVTPMTGNSKNRFDFAKVDSNMQINQSTKQRVSLETLDSVSIIVDQILHIVNWLDSASSSSHVPKFNIDFKNIMLRLAVELASTAQRDQFVEKPNDVIKKTSSFLAGYCEWVVSSIDDPDFIQPCWLDVVSIQKKPDEEDFGIVMRPSTTGSLTIEEVVFSSPAHRSGRVSIGDEIIQVDYQTVVNWPLERVKSLVESYNSEIILTLKKKPQQSTLNLSVVVMKPYAIPLKRILSHTSESLHPDLDSLDRDKSADVDSFIEGQGSQVEEPPKEPKGPVYELQPSRPRRELTRSASISGSISDALVDLAIADALPSIVKPRTPPATTPTLAGKSEKSRLMRLTKENLTKSMSHDTAKLYVHSLSIDRKHLWHPQSSKRDLL